MPGDDAELASYLRIEERELAAQQRCDCRGRTPLDLRQDEHPVAVTVAVLPGRCERP